MPPPAAGHTPAETPAPAAQHAPAAGNAPTGARENSFARGVEGAAKGSWKLLKGIAGFFGRRVKGVLSGGWEATGGQVTGELAEAGRRLGYENKETGPLHAIAGVIEGIGGRIAKVVGGVVDFTIGAPARAAGRVLRGAQNVVTGVVFGKTFEKGGTAERHGEETAAHAAGAAGAH